MQKTIKLLVLLFAWWPPFHAFSCLCDGSRDIERHFYDSYFVGTCRVIGVRREFEETPTPKFKQTVVKLEILKKFKGKESDSITIHSGLSNCEFNFKENEKYLVFAYLDNQTIRCSSCGPSTEFAKAEQSIKIVEFLISENQ